MDVAYSSESPTKPAAKPNACEQCRAFKRVREEYFPPSTHFAHCRHFVDQGVIRMAGTSGKGRS